MTKTGHLFYEYFNGGFMNIVNAKFDLNSDLLMSYTYGPGIDNLLAITVHGNGAPVTYRAITDHLGTVHALAGASGIHCVTLQREQYLGQI